MLKRRAPACQRRQISEASALEVLHQVRLSGVEALPAIVDYQERAAIDRQGRLGRTAALIELLGGTAVRDPPTENDREFLAKMIAVAELIETS